MPEDRLYFIALIPHSILFEDILNLKKEMKTRFKAGHALKSPAHITLQMPFRRMESEEARISEVLQEFAYQQTSFTVNLSGFGSFPPRVIFVKVKDHTPIIQLHARLRKQLLDQLNFPPSVLNTKFHPHMTIATRDLQKEAFHRAWPEFKKRTFTASFEVTSIFLLKHNSKHWDIHQEFKFKV